MDADLFLLVGALCIGLAFVSFLNAFTHGAFPRVALAMVALGAGLTVYANHLRPQGYRFDEIPAVFGRVFGQFIG